MAKKEGRDIVKIQLSCCEAGDIRTALTQESFATVLGGLHYTKGTSGNVAPSGTTYYGNMSELLRPIYRSNPDAPLTSPLVGECFRHIATAGGRAQELCEGLYMDTDREYEESHLPVQNLLDLQVNDFYRVLCVLGYENGIGSPKRMNGLLFQLVRGVKFYSLSVRNNEFEWVPLPGFCFGLRHLSAVIGAGRPSIVNRMTEDGGRTVMYAVPSEVTCFPAPVQWLITEEVVCSGSGYVLDLEDFSEWSRSISKNQWGENELVEPHVLVGEDQIPVTGKDWVNKSGRMLPDEKWRKVPNSNEAIKGPPLRTVCHKLKCQEDFEGFNDQVLRTITGKNLLNITGKNGINQRSSRSDRVQAIMNHNNV